MKAQPPRAKLSEEEIRALSPAEQARAIAEWSSYNARLRRENEEREARVAFRGSYRGFRGRGSRGRGGGYHAYQPYPLSPYSRQKYSSVTANFSQGGALVATENTQRAPAIALTSGSKATTNADPKDATPCPTFTATGLCRQPQCPLVHDPEKTAICKRYLFKDDCAYADACPLSHVPSPHRCPNCLHFQNNSCTKEMCRYAHVRINPNAPVCEKFARLGYCDKGETCSDRHVFDVCPDFANKGTCEVVGCRLPHIINAATLRKAAKSHPSSDTNTPSSPRSPKEKTSTGGTIGAHNVSVQPDQAHPYSFTQQADFVPFES